MVSLPQKVLLTEVGPRDGLQNESQPVSVTDKLEFIRLLTAAGLTDIEAGAFVSPKWVPQMADSEKIFAKIRTEKFPTDVTYTALVPNEKGMALALKAGVKKIAIFTAASETFNQKNINCSIAASFDRFKPVLKMAAENAVAVRGYISAAFVCPYEGVVVPQKTADVLSRFLDMGVNDISIGDTTGKATPPMVQALLELLIIKLALPKEDLAMHFHDTYGVAIANIYESLKFHIARFDASAGGLGGCPYAPGAAGNVATNDVVWFLQSLGIETGVDLEKLNAATVFIQNVLGKTLPSRVLAVQPHVPVMLV